MERKADGGAEVTGESSRRSGGRKLLAVPQSKVGVGTLARLPQEVALSPASDGFASCSYLKISSSPPSLDSDQQAAREQKAEAPPSSSPCNGSERGHWSYRLIGH